MGNKENSFDDFFDRFDALVNEAKKYGIESVVIVMDNDPLKDCTVMRTVRHGHFYGAIGALEQLKHQLLSEEKDQVG